MKKSVLISAAKKARILLAVMTLCGMSFVGTVPVDAAKITNDDKGKIEVERDGSNIISIGTDNNYYTGNGISLIGVENTVYGSAVNHLANNIFGYKNIVGEEGSENNKWNNAFGNDNTVIGGYATAVGNKNIVKGARSSAFGHDNTVNAIGATALGSENKINNDNNASSFSVGVGSNNEINNIGIAVGRTNVLSGEYASGFGYDNTVSSDKGLAMGKRNEVTGANATAFGYVNQAYDEYVTTAGNFNTGSQKYATVIGYQNNPSL